jgi:uncharacterized repeat protein (TIGR01451 family)
MPIDPSASPTRCSQIASLVFMGVAWLFAQGPALAQGSFINQVKLSAADGDEEDYLGSAVAASGDSLAAGVPYDWNGLTFSAGSVYVFQHNAYTWAQVQKLQPADGASDDEFGLALAMHGDLLFIGAPGHNQRQGAVYLYQRQSGTWQFAQKILAGDAASGHAFGAALAFDGVRLAVGAPSASSARGAAYVFNRSASQWVQTQKLTASDGASGDTFGSALALDGSRLAVGARLDDLVAPGDNRGSVYVYADSGGGFAAPAKLTLANGRDNDEFGRSLALQGDHLLVAAPFRDSGASQDNSGAVYHYRFTSGTWTLQSTLVDPQNTASATLGASLALRGGTALIGAPVANNTTGFVLHFELVAGAWQFRERMLAADARPFEFFGKSVALSEEHAIVGAEFADVGANVEQGAVYVQLRAATRTLMPGVNPSPSRVGESLQVDVRVESDLSTPGGTVLVQSSDGPSCVASLSAGVGSCTLPGHTLGIKTLTARYDGAAGLGASSVSREHRVVPDLRITTSTLPKGKIGRAYEQWLMGQAGGATEPLLFSVSAGALPPGISLASDGRLAGTTLEPGVYNFQAQLSDSSAASLGGPFTTTRSFILDIDPAFSTTLDLQSATTTGDRGQSLTVTAVLDVVEPEAAPPSGSYVVSANNGAHSLGCSAPVSAEGQQQCALDFGFGDPEGLYTITARFVPSQADYGSSQDQGSHELYRAFDLSVQLVADRSLYRPNEFITYTVTVQNLGPDSASGAALQVQPGAGLGELSWTCTGAACPASNGLGPISTSLDLDAGAGLVFQLRGRVASPTPASVLTLATVSPPSPSFQRDTQLANNSASHSAQPLALFGDGFED